MEAYEVMIERCKSLKLRYHDLEQELMSPALLANQREYAKVAKEQATLRQIVEAYEDLEGLNHHMREASDMMKEDDDEIKAMAQAELEELTLKQEALIAHLHLLLIPKDPNDEHNAIVEIRGAAGGDEGNIFAGDLYRMYGRYCELNGFKLETLEVNEAEMGGFTLISFLVKGNEAYKHFKFESGAHRVQRVPKTETQGRIHTSTATVLVMPDIEEAESDINPADLTIETHRSSGAGGQHVNKTDSAVRITHVPTGINVNCQDGRSQHDNKATAMRLIRARVFEYMEEKALAEKGKLRMEKVGTGDRSEKIRTYNYPQNRVTDHRIGLTLQQLDRIVEGKLDDVINALLDEEQRQKLAGNA